MRPAAEILLVESEALRPILERRPSDEFLRPTVCTGWSVRHVLAHCGAALTHVAAGTVHRFTPEDNQADVDQRAAWPIEAVLEELLEGYAAAASAIDGAGGRLDGVGIGEWMHGGDVREALEEPNPYVSAGVDLALGLLLERSRAVGKPGIQVFIGDEVHSFGAGAPEATLRTDLETFVRLTGARRPDSDRFWLEGAEPADLVLFS